MVEAAPARVWPALLTRLRAVHGAAGAHAGTAEEDPQRHLFAVQGGWWYRGEHRLAGHAVGTAVTFSVYNIARRGRWAVPLVLWQYRVAGNLSEATVTADFAGTLRTIGDDLDCRAYLTPSQA